MLLHYYRKMTEVKQGKKLQRDDAAFVNYKLSTTETYLRPFGP